MTEVDTILSMIDAAMSPAGDERKASCCACGQPWDQHKPTPNGALACTYHGCGRRDVVLP